jgi:hypothetical protein
MYADLGASNIVQSRPLPILTTAGSYFNAPLYAPPRSLAPAPVAPPVRIIPTFTPTQMPVLIAKPTAGASTTPSPFSPSATAPSVNVSVSGGAGVSPSGTITPESTSMAGMLGDVNPTMLVFLGMAALVAFMESGKRKGR